MEWLNDEWCALRWEEVDCGKLVVPTGHLLICAPFCYLDSKDLTVGIRIRIPAGAYSVKLSDGVSGGIGYASLIISDKAETSRRQFLDMPEAIIPENIDRSNDYIGVPVETGTVCFVDEGALEYGMPPDKKLWDKQVIRFEGADERYIDIMRSQPFSWERIRAQQALKLSWEELRDQALEQSIIEQPEGESEEPDKEATTYLSGEEHWNYLLKNNKSHFINTRLPLASDGANIIMAHNFGGDGYYPVAGSYDAEDNLVAVHIVLYDPRGLDDEN
ncbi:MAG: DUF4241 domain-containing protein [Acidobacteria bacterium]|jgi:hypothetical protein|nr:DUF4241 domain-containing protein [Acidobacteriota bacterium]